MAIKIISNIGTAIKNVAKSISSSQSSSSSSSSRSSTRPSSNSKANPTGSSSSSSNKSATDALLKPATTQEMARSIMETQAITSILGPVPSAIATAISAIPIVTGSSGSSSKSSSSSSYSSSSSRSSSRSSSYKEPEFVYVPPPQKLVSKTATRYFYTFGIDDVQIGTRKINPNCAMVTKEIKLNNTETIEIDAIHKINDNTSIEYSIIDGDKEVPILPIDEERVINERIFFGLPLRFTVDESKNFVIKKDGKEINISIDDAINSNDGIYTITYTPLNAHQYKPSNSTIRLKFVLRTYNEFATPPYISYVAIRNYGGDSLWLEKL